MKVAVLAAGDSSRNFPLFIDRPKCLYSYNGKIQLSRVIDNLLQYFDKKDIIIVSGYKYKKIQSFVASKYPGIKIVVNKNFKGPAIYSFRTAIQECDDDFLFLGADESIKNENLLKIAQSERKMALLCHDEYYYYSLGIFKLRKDMLNILKDDCYLSMEYMKKVYCFANKKKIYDGDFRIYDGVCGGYIIIDLVRRIGNITVIENPVTSYFGKEIEFIHYDPKSEYIADLDYIELTDEYKRNMMLRIYNICISKVIKKIHRHIVPDSKFK